MTTLQQRTPAWHAARRGKLTCSNLGALLGQVSYTSRPQAYRRALGLERFQGNNATQWGTDNEPNGLSAYMERTGNVVTATGLHVHSNYNWLAGSPDGFIGEEGMVEVKCPFYARRDGSSRVHKKVPGHYWIQMNALLEITGREWCDYVCWAPEGMAVYRVYKDSETFDYLLQHYIAINAAINMLADQPPAMSAKTKGEIASKIEEAMAKGVDLEFWAATVTSQPPAREDSETESTEDGDTLPAAKRQRLSEESTEGSFSDTTETGNGNPVCIENPGGSSIEAAQSLSSLCNS